MGLLSFTTLVLLTLLSLSSLTIAQSSFNFNCTLNTTCQALVGYVSPNTTSLSNIQTLFSVKNFHSLLGANNLPLSTPANHTINATQTVKVPIPCICIDNTGVSNKVPIYTVQQDDGPYHIAADVFSALVDFETITKMNKISDPNLIEVGQKIWIPLPCSCDEVKGEKVVHYAHAVNEGSSLEEIVNEFGIPEETVTELIARAAMDSKFAIGVPIDIPLKACSSSIINDSEDSSLLVSNGTYLLTANQCVKCQCNSANNWTLQCEPSQLKPSNWSVCPSMQCGDFKTLYIGNTTMNGCDKTTCAYAGYSANQTIFTTLETTSTCPRNTSKLVMIAAIAASAVGIGVGVLMIIVCCFRRRFPSYEFILFGKKKPQKYQNVEAFLRNNAQLLSKRYSYSEVKKMTNSFRDKLGQGGYGGVYKGKLNDGSLVAVKVLNESKGNGEEFINEVASISRTSHVNIVTLLGFCFEGSKRALIYEFMPNGSLEKFIYENTHSKADRLLGWESLYRIAFGIAQGLEYLHRGCSTRILHFDIKPHNILLDEEFSPKISDFGLAKICPRKESIISMTGARGTAGYIAPELFCRNFGGVSHKSDVYSYGMMMLEMVGGRKNICVGVDRTSEIYFPQWICKHLELGEELELHGVRDEEEKKIARKMILVGLWCIQTDPSNRPPMSRVVEMLQGSVASLPIPPTPFLSSPPRTVENSLTASITTL